MSTKSKFMLLSIVFTLLLAACGGPATTAAPTAAAVEPTSESAFPVTIEHKYGSTTLVEAPERIVLVGLTEQDALLALGVVPVATREWFGGLPGAIFPWAEDKLGNAPLPKVLSADELNFEQIAALEPDVIIGLYSGMTEEEYETLSQIAPTVAQPADYANYGIPWQELTRTVGLVVGKGPQAEALIEEVEASFAQVREQHPEFGEAVGVVATPYGYPDNYWLHSSQDSRARILALFGFQPSTEIDEVVGEAFAAPISRERLDLLNDVDVLVWVPTTAEEVETLNNDPLYQQLDVVAEGRDVIIEPASSLYAGFNFVSVLSLPYVLENTLPLVTAAVDGDPATTDAVFPVTLEHKFGSTTITSEPKRVITLGFSEQDPVLALGVVPIAIREWFGEQPSAVWPWGQDKLGGESPEVLNMTFGELNFEAIAALEPDLIVATHSGITEDEYTTLAQIAPTLAQPGEYPDFGVPWQEQTRLIGKALGRSVQAEALVADVEAQIAEAAAAHPEFTQATIAWATPTGTASEFWVVGPNTPPLRFLSALGFQYPEDTAEVVGDLDSAQVSGERIDLIDTDVLIVRVGSEEEQAALEADALFQQLSVVQEERTILFVGNDPIYGALSFSTVLSLPYALEGLVPQLAAAVEAQ